MMPLIHSYAARRAGRHRAMDSTSGIAIRTKS